MTEALPYINTASGSMNADISKQIEIRIMQLGGVSYFFHQDTNSKTPKLLTDKKAISNFVYSRLHTVSFNNQLFCYDSTTGIYTPDKGQVNATINELCRICETEEFIPTIQEFTRKMLLGKNVYTGEYPFNLRTDQIPFRNGTLYLMNNEWVLKDKLPSDMVTWRIPHDYNPNAPIEPAHSVLSQWVIEDDVRILCQIPAHALRQLSVKSPYKISYLTYGTRDSAKSTYCDLIKFAFNGMISSVPLQEVGARFSGAVMEGKLFNIYDDLDNSAVRNMGAFKAYTGTFEQDIEHKGRDKYRGFIRCVHLFTVNPPLPKIDRTDEDSYFSRWRLIRFPNRFKRDTDWFSRTVTEEFIQGFFNLLLIEYQKIIDEGLYNPQTPEEVRQAWLGTAEEIPFIISCLDVQPEDHIGEPYQIPVAECYTLYCEYMKDNKKTNIKEDGQFGRAMAYAVGATKHRPRIDGKQVAVYYGIRKKGFEPKTIQESNQKDIEAF